MDVNPPPPTTKALSPSPFHVFPFPPLPFLVPPLFFTSVLLAPP